ncbi:hypothetical protein BRD14_04725 [Halobacteriales archaeon SW_5_68_122]|nr:MAG: hypothetical protein BRD14_04725 [Halobacteriales archaeon SW_5_68_122]
MVHTRDEGEVPPVWRNQTRRTIEGLLEQDMVPASHEKRVVELLEAGRPTEALALYVDNRHLPVDGPPGLDSQFWADAATD